MKQKQTERPSHPKPISKRALLKFAASGHAARPMIFWEKAKIWDWRALLKAGEGRPDKELLLNRLSELHIHFADETVPDHPRSMVFIVEATMPTQREWLRLSEKYGYNTGQEGDV